MNTKLIVGLGNIGQEYNSTRHNIGFIILDYLSTQYNVTFSTNKKIDGFICSFYVGSTKCILLKPATYMNKSGTAVFQTMQYFKICLDDMIVFHDDIDLVLHKIRIRNGGGNGGHKGLRSISESCGNNYIKVGYGVDRPRNSVSVSDYVLQKFDFNTLNEINTRIHENFSSIESILDLK